MNIEKANKSDKKENYDLSSSGQEQKYKSPQFASFKTIAYSDSKITEGKISPEPEIFQSKLPDLFDRYDIIEKFAEGGQGDIKIAQDKFLKRIVAVKTLKKCHVTDINRVNSFITEAKLTAQLDHPSIIPVYSLDGDDEDGLHIAMKLIKGKTLQDVIDETVIKYNKLPTNDLIKIESSALKSRIDILIKVCDAISYAHKKGVVHRDIKPENIMVGDNHDVYLMDWGIASPLSKPNSPPTSSEENISGTPGYLAPEILLGDGWSEAGDQYSLGVVLFELVTLKRAFVATQLNAMIKKNAQNNHEPIEHFFKKIPIPPELIAIIKKAMHSEPKQRYQSVEALADDLRKFIRDEETTAFPDNLLRKTFRILYKYKTYTALFILTILLAFSAISILSLIKQRDAIIESKRRTAILLGKHSSITEIAHRFDNKIFETEHSLLQLSDKAGFLHQSPLPNSLVNTDLCDFRDFKKNLSSSTQVVFSENHRQKVDFNAAVYKLPSHANIDIKTEIQSKKYLAKLMSKTYWGQLRENANFAELDKNKNLPFTWIYVAFENGIIINYPAAASFEDDFDPRKREWYLNAIKNDDIVWSKPYLDAISSNIMLTASKKIESHDGGILGVAGFDITFSHILKIMIEGEKTKSNAVIRRYIIDSDRNIIFCYDTEKSDKTKISNEKGLLIFPPFPYPQISEVIKKKNSGELEIEDSEPPIMLSYAKLESLNMFYIEEINLDKLFQKKYEYKN